MPLLGIMEEIGELSHHYLKRAQGIRMSEDHEEGIKDAVADIVIFLMDFCSANDIDLQSAIEDVWAVVKKRDWKTDSKHGKHPTKKK
jgi:NTP pyrophosphatase (non-canonical NTP hydrolase)